MPTRKVACLGLSHHHTPVELRERLCTSLETIQATIESEQDERESPFAAIRELALLHTCNRVELYGVVEACETGARHVLTAALCRATGISPLEVREYLYHHTGLDAARHLGRVACGLESQVLGEQQILGQVTECQETAERVGLMGSTLSIIFRAAIKSGRRARRETEINRHPVSVSSVAIGHAQSLLGDLLDREVLVVGAGEMGVLTLKALQARGIEQVRIANRTLDRAERVAASFGYEAVPIESLDVLLNTADVVVTATGAVEPIITADLMRGIMSRRAEHDIVLIDISVPRNVAADVVDVPGVRAFDTDDLHDAVDKARTAREKEVPAVEQILEDEITSLQRTMQKRVVAPLITDLRQKAETIRQKELERTFRHLNGVDEETRNHIQHLSQALVNKLLHEPTSRIKAEAGNGHTDEFVSTIRNLFGLAEEKSASS